MSSVSLALSAPHLPPTPIRAPPPGVTANFDHPNSNAYRAYIAAGACIPIIVLFASLRIYSNLYVHRSRTWSDLAFMLATVWALIYQGLIMGSVNQGFFGKHAWDLKLDDARNAPFLFILLLESLYGPFIWIIKLSMFLMYLQLFGTVRYFRHLVWVGILVSGLYYFSSTVASVVLCAPRGRQTYIFSFATPRCHKSVHLLITTGIFNVLSDLYLLLLPIRETMRIRTSLRKRIGVLAVFMTGFA
ncbi:MAG: hypothetical protein LQ350_001601 [Teloschistes chrysophthalmus]|nr:MAG: hypothetical protein LQ350_001601 [Niorma chrysophthalma]